MAYGLTQDEARTNATVLANYVPDTGAIVQGDDLSPQPNQVQDLLMFCAALSPEQRATLHNAMAERWGLVQGNVSPQPEVSPTVTLMATPPDHTPAPDCWCHPTEVERGVFVHNEAVRN